MRSSRAGRHALETTSILRHAMPIGCLAGRRHPKILTALAQEHGQPKERAQKDPGEQGGSSARSPRGRHRRAVHPCLKQRLKRRYRAGRRLVAVALIEASLLRTTLCGWRLGSQQAVRPPAPVRHRAPANRGGSGLDDPLDCDFVPVL